MLVLRSSTEKLRNGLYPVDNGASDLRMEQRVRRVNDPAITPSEEAHWNKPCWNRLNNEAGGAGVHLRKGLCAERRLSAAQTIGLMAYTTTPNSDCQQRKRLAR